MGARISVQFKNGERTSPVLFDHWGGTEFLGAVNEFAITMYKQVEEQKKERPNLSDPFSRLEPEHAMVRFIVWLGKTGKYQDSMYLGVNENDGDNSDYGHHIFDLENLPKNFLK